MTEPHPQPQEDDVTEPAPEADAAPASAEEALRAEVAALKDQLLRALADAENTRRRAQKEREDTAKYAVGNFARDMLTVADNFRRALDAAPKETDDPALKNLLTGVEMTARQLQATLERFGIREMTPMGQPFDPNYHRVMMEVDSPDAAPGTVTQVLQAGYVIHDRLLREALVAVAKGGAPAAPKVDTSA